MTVATRCAEEGLLCIPIQLAPCVKRWVLCKDPSLVGTREAYASARVFARYTDVAHQLGLSSPGARWWAGVGGSGYVAGWRGRIG